MPLYCDSVSGNARRNCHSERAESSRRPSGRFAAAIANTSGFSTTSNCRSPPTEAAPSIRGAGPVLAGAALRTNGPKRGAAVFHGHPIDVPGRSLGPPLQTVDFDSVRRCRHGQLLHCLALILLWPARLRRSRTLFRSIAAPRAQIARPGGDTPGQPRVPFACRISTTRTSWFIGLGFSIRSQRMAGPRG